MTCDDYVKFTQTAKVLLERKDMNHIKKHIKKSNG